MDPGNAEAACRRPRRSARGRRGVTVGEHLPIDHVGRHGLGITDRLAATGGAVHLDVGLVDDRVRAEPGAKPGRSPARRSTTSGSVPYSTNTAWAPSSAWASAVGQHERHRLTGEHHLVAGQWLRHTPGPAADRQVIADENSVHAGHLERRPLVDRDDLGVGMRRSGPSVHAGDPAIRTSAANAAVPVTLDEASMRGRRAPRPLARLSSTRLVIAAVLSRPGTGGVECAGDGHQRQLAAIGTALAFDAQLNTGKRLPDRLLCGPIAACPAGPARPAAGGAGMTPRR